MYGWLSVMLGPFLSWGGRPLLRVEPYGAGIRYVYSESPDGPNIVWAPYQSWGGRLQRYLTRLWAAGLCGWRPVGWSR